MDHPSIMAHTYADLYGSDLDTPGPRKSHGAFEQSESHYEQALTVARGGIEPPTYRFSGGRSYQLSYLAGHRERREFSGRARPLADR